MQNPNSIGAGEIQPVEVIRNAEVLGREFQIYGTAENPLFLAKDVAAWIEHSNHRAMLDSVDEDWIYKQGQIYYPSSKIRGKNYADFHVIPYVNRDGETLTREHLKWTESGRRAIIELWNKKKMQSA